MLLLKQSTAIDIRMGPFVDVVDGFTPEIGVTIGTSDEAEVLKANGAATVPMAGAFAAVSGCDAWYDYTAAAGDVDTVGEVVFVMQDDSVYLPVFVRGYVVEENVHDTFFAASATAGTKLDNLPEGVQKNQALSNFPFLMVDSTDHVTGKTGRTITATRSIDGAAFAPTGNTATEIASGMYKIDLTAADLNGDTITFLFTATASDNRLITLVTNP